MRATKAAGISKKTKKHAYYTYNFSIFCGVMYKNVQQVERQKQHQYHPRHPQMVEKITILDREKSFFGKINFFTAPCAITQWGEWRHCIGRCEYGLRTRHRTVSGAPRCKSDFSELDAQGCIPEFCGNPPSPIHQPPPITSYDGGSKVGGRRTRTK
jgi:hypothetical protein